MAKLKEPLKLAASALFALALTTPALGDPPDGAREAQSNYLGGPIDSAQDVHPALDICVQLMERAFYLNDPSRPELALDARQEMERAREAFHNGDESACERHAMHALEDRT
jgi:hypothetical protein